VRLRRGDLADGRRRRAEHAARAAGSAHELTPALSLSIPLGGVTTALFWYT
jgi:hypothetical protein